MIAPLVVDPNGCTYVASYGPPLGVVANLAYDETTIGLQPEQAVVFISDGIVEARNPANDMWGFAKLETTVCEAALQGTEGIVSLVVAATKQHMRDTPPTDDMTIIAATLTPRLEEDNAYLMEPFATQLRSSL
jgi:sigma-B regulation protein RsbU (phosphoserine phosphatase)